MTHAHWKISNVAPQDVQVFVGYCLFIWTTSIDGTRLRTDYRLHKGYNTVWSELCECIRANSLQTVL